MRNRLAITATAVSIFIFLSYILLPGTSTPTHTPPPSNFQKSAYSLATSSHSSLAAVNHEPDAVPYVKVSPDLLKGGVIMPKLGNETIKAELGRASWKLLHTMLARYPVKPQPEEREALRDYILLFSRLYPCGECAEHFQALLKQYPPQTSSRDVASQWGCFVHNQVNERLKKEVFDCALVTEHYKCGCADAEGEIGEGGEKGKEGEVKGAVEGDKVPWRSNKTLDENVEESRKHGAKIEVEKTGLINGG